MTEHVGTPVFATTPPRPAFDPELVPALEAMGMMRGGSTPVRADPASHAEHAR
ncbi:hypothetical protein ACFS5L_37720 [Streptomyces phyllanthi]|uniref:hypothetical protein n=1 Tax=Streptomyces phyllanthi TaxID=1803180 RepID=UPI0018838524|nr:hypothetical protein [Streptomyces phyllanthi]